MSTRPFPFKALSLHMATPLDPGYAEWRKKQRRSNSNRQMYLNIASFFLVIAVIAAAGYVAMHP